MKYPLTCLSGSNNLAFVSVPVRSFAGKTALGTGTGFLFRPEFGQLFLITNRHIVIQESEEFFPDRIEIRLHTDGSNLTRFEDLSLVLYSANNKVRPAWFELDSGIDIVALKLDYDELKRFVFHAFTPNDLISPDIVVGVGDPLLVIGYPLGFSDEVHHLPVFRL